MINKKYTIAGMTCGSCAMRIEDVIGKLGNVEKVYVDFSKKTMSVDSNVEIGMDELQAELEKIGEYRLSDYVEKKKTKKQSVSISATKISVATWGTAGAIFITIAFYLVQALGMQSWSAPYSFMTDQWYLVAPLILAFAIQLGLFRAIHLKSKHGGGAAMGVSGGISTGAMIACCMHNLVLLLPILGISGLAVMFATYQTSIFVGSIILSYSAVGYMVYKYRSIRDNSCCKK